MALVYVQGCTQDLKYRRAEVMNVFGRHNDNAADRPLREGVKLAVTRDGNLLTSWELCFYSDQLAH